MSFLEEMTVPLLELILCNSVGSNTIVQNFNGKDLTIYLQFIKFLFHFKFCTFQHKYYSLLGYPLQ